MHPRRGVVHMSRDHHVIIKGERSFSRSKNLLLEGGLDSG